MRVSESRIKSWFLFVGLSLLLLQRPLAAGPERIDPAQLETLRKRAKAGDVPTQLFLAEAFYFGNGIPIDLPLSRFWAAEASSNRSPRGMALYALLMMYGNGGLKDIDKARRMGKDCHDRLKEQAEAGDPGSQAWLAWLLSEGLGVEQDPKAAIAWAEKSAKAGNAFGQDLLGTFYCGGIGTEKDIGEGLLWYRQASEQKLAVAQHNVARLLTYSPKIKDPVEAIRWWTLAADQNHPGAQTALGIAFEEGVGTTADPIIAAGWYSMAKAEDATAARRFSAVWSKLDAEGKARVRELVASLKKKILEQR